MAIYPGKTEGGLIGRPLDERTYLADDMQTADVNTYDPLIYSVPANQTGTEVVQLPAAVSNIYPALLKESVNNPFYQGVYFQQDAVIVNQTAFDVGFVSADFSTFFELFSTSSAKRTVQSLTIAPAASGITISGLSVSDVFYPYEEKTVGLVISLAGNAVIQSTFSIKFVEDPITYVMDIVGARVGSFFLADPNWADGITVERKFLTSVFTAFDMSETRKILRYRPVRTMQASLTFHNRNSAGRMWALTRDAAKQTTAHPWYPDYSAMPADSTVNRVYCETEYRRFQAGGYAFLVAGTRDAGYDHFESVRIDEVFADGFSTVFPIVSSYNAGDAVYPAFVCDASLVGNPSVLMTDRVGTIDILAEERYSDSTMENENSAYTPVIREGLPTLDVLVTFSETPEIAVLMGGTSSSSGRGMAITKQGVPYVVQQVTALCRTKAICWNTIGFFNYLKGRGKPFWVRSELDFLNITGSSGNATVIVDNPNQLRDWDYLDYLWVEDSTGAFDVIRVIDRQPVTGGFEFTLDTNALADISLIWHAHNVRLAEDLITEEYLTDSIMVSTFSVQELQGG